jgi:hypothetical protein
MRRLFIFPIHLLISFQKQQPFTGGTEMQIDTLDAVGAIDGRYHEKTEALSSYMSEWALMSNRIPVAGHYVQLLVGYQGITRIFLYLSKIFKQDLMLSLSISMIKREIFSGIREKINYWRIN